MTTIYVIAADETTIEINTASYEILPGWVKIHVGGADYDVYPSDRVVMIQERTNRKASAPGTPDRSKYKPYGA
jgi:hypothetical protein